MNIMSRLRRQLALVCAVVTGLVLVVMAAASFYFSARQLRTQSEASFSSTLNTVFFYLQGQDVISHTWLAQMEASGSTWISVESGENCLFYTSLNPVRTELTTRARETARDDYGFDLLAAPASCHQPDTVSFLMNTGHGQYRAAVSRVPLGEEWLLVTILAATEQSAVRSLALVFGGCVGLAVLCLAVFAWLFTGRAVRPVEESRRRQTEFVSAASHELRSPLAVLQVSAEGLKDSPPEMHDRLADIILGECARLSRLAGDLLGLAGADSRGWSMSPAPESPETILLRAAESFEPLAVRKGILLKTEIPSPPLPKTVCDSQRIGQVLTILLDNALRYTPRGGEIRLEVYRRARQICFSVADNGPGIPDDQKEAVFERFYQCDAARTDKENYGLGLAIAREIALAHKGELTVGDAVPAGAVFVLRIPARGK